MNIEFDSYKQRLNEVKPALDGLADSLNLEGLKNELERLHAMQEAPGFWDNPEKSQQIVVKTRQTETKIQHYEKMRSSWDDLMTICEMAAEEDDDSMLEELKEGFAKLVLIGNPDQIHHLASEYYLDEIGKATIVDPENNPKKEEYVELMLKLRASKGLTREQAEKLIVDPLYLAALMVKNGNVDGEVAGANNATGCLLYTSPSPRD